MDSGRSNRVTLSGGKTVKGKMEVPGDKSISHRGLLLGAIADGRTRIDNLAPGDDVRSTVACLKDLGVTIVEREGGVVVEGRGGTGLSRPDDRLNAGNSGTLTRLIAGILATVPFSVEIDGDESLRERPMERIIAPLERMGAKIESRAGKLPLKVSGGDLTGIEHHPEVASAQVKSSVLLAGLGATGRTVVVEPGPSRDHTERMLAAMGYPIEVNGNRIAVYGPDQLDPLDLKVPGDFSSAGYFIAAALLVEGSELTVKNVGLNETRTGFLDLVRRMGGSIEVKNSTKINQEPRGDLLVSSSELTGIRLTEEEVVKSIDELPLLAVLATGARGKTEVRGAEELRVKETDRITATVENLKNLGADIRELPDGFVVNGPTKLNGGAVDSYGDHRIAMSMAIAALVAEGNTDIVGPEWVEVSFPGFFDQLEEITRE